MKTLKRTCIIKAAIIVLSVVLLGGCYASGGFGVSSHTNIQTIVS